VLQADSFAATVFPEGTTGKGHVTRNFGDGGPAGAYACYYFYELLRDGKAAPLITTFSATLVSSCAFVAVATVFLFGTILSRFGDFGAFLVAYLPIIIGTAVLNAVIVQLFVLLYGRVTARGPA